MKKNELELDRIQTICPECIDYLDIILIPTKKGMRTASTCNRCKMHYVDDDFKDEFTRRTKAGEKFSIMESISNVRDED